MKLHIPYTLDIPDTYFARGQCAHEPKFAWWQPFIIRRFRWSKDGTKFYGFNIWTYTRWGAHCSSVSWPK